jgi:hypothetical protein
MILGPNKLMPLIFAGIGEWVAINVGCWEPDKAP